MRLWNVNMFLLFWFIFSQANARFATSRQFFFILFFQIFPPGMRTGNRRADVFSWFSVQKYQRRCFCLNSWSAFSWFQFFVVDLLACRMTNIDWTFERKFEFFCGFFFLVNFAWIIRQTGLSSKSSRFGETMSLISLMFREIHFYLKLNMLSISSELFG